MKKYFLFDDEPITGSQYLIRVIVGSILSAIIIGLWILASAGYKRSGALGWSNELRIFCSIAIPIHGLGNLVAREVDSFGANVDLIFLGLSIFHLILLFKNGNKNLVK
tara:strand:- start:103 stop:426 length:324 start_codon:yes stop_codon:yes gene_type:complete